MLVVIKTCAYAVSLYILNIGIHGHIIYVLEHCDYEQILDLDAQVSTKKP